MKYCVDWVSSEESFEEVEASVGAQVWKILVRIGILVKLA